MTGVSPNCSADMCQLNLLWLDAGGLQQCDEFLCTPKLGASAIANSDWLVGSCSIGQVVIYPFVQNLIAAANGAIGLELIVAWKVHPR